MLSSQVYLQTQNIYLADCTFKILTKLKPEDHELQRRYADFLIGNGLIYDGIDVLMVDLRRHISGMTVYCMDWGMLFLVWLFGLQDCYMVSVVAAETDVSFTIVL